MSELLPQISFGPILRSRNGRIQFSTCKNTESEGLVFPFQSVLFSSSSLQSSSSSVSSTPLGLNVFDLTDMVPIGCKQYTIDAILGLDKNRHHPTRNHRSELHSRVFSDGREDGDPDDEDGDPDGEDGDPDREDERTGARIHASHSGE